MPKKPYLSFVVTSRNDDHLTDQQSLQRLFFFIKHLYDGLRKSSNIYEIIIADWNTPENTASLYEELKNKLAPPPNTIIRFINIPPDIHSTFEHHNKVSLFQMIAKNVGIRRSNAEFILATNIDIIFSESILKLFHKQKLKKNTLYRIDRTDVRHQTPNCMDYHEQLKHCYQNVYKIYSHGFTLAVKHPLLLPLYALWARCKTFKAYQRKPQLVHTNACGDFTLMDHDSWFSIKGNPELHKRAFKLDGLTCYAAKYSGIREHILHYPFCIFHIEHQARGDGMDIVLKEELEKKTTHALQISRDEYFNYIQQMNRLNAPIIFNNENWGLFNVALEENLIPE